MAGTALLPPGSRRVRLCSKERAVGNVVMADPTPFLLDGWLWCMGCRLRMVPAMRRDTRVYRCTGTCRSGGGWVDALLVDCLVWDRVVRYRRELAADGQTVDERRAVLQAATRRIEVDIDPVRVRMVWLPRQTVNTPRRGAGERTGDDGDDVLRCGG